MICLNNLRNLLDVTDTGRNKCEIIVTGRPYNLSCPSYNGKHFKYII